MLMLLMMITIIDECMVTRCANIAGDDELGGDGRRPMHVMYLYCGWWVEVEL